MAPDLNNSEQFRGYTVAFMEQTKISLKKLEENQAEIYGKLQQVQGALTALKVKVSLIGVAAGIVAGGMV